MSHLVFYRIYEQKYKELYIENENVHLTPYHLIIVQSIRMKCQDLCK